MNTGPFRILDRINTDELFKRWTEEKPPEDFAEPLEGWHVKNCRAFENNSAVVLFENSSDKERSYYRWHIYELSEDTKLKLNKRLRTFPEHFIIEDFGYDGDTIYTCQTNIDNGKHEVRAYRSDNTYVAMPDDYELLALSDSYLLLFTEHEIMLVSFPDDLCLSIAEKLSLKIKRWISSEDETSEEQVFSNTETEFDDEWDDEDRPNVEVVIEKQNEKPALDELNEMIGLDDVKTQINRIAAFAAMKKAMLDGKVITDCSVNMNMMFCGAPGTAKTTVARIVAKILKEKQILSNGGLIEVGRSDLVAKYLGQTAPKVKDVFERAKGNLLFIDEAYSLIDGDDNQYGDEAIATIVQEMENNRNDLVVIFAGYKNEMDKFLSKNPGLRSRVPFVIDFKDYSSDELVQIVKLEAKKRGFSISPEADSKILDICSTAKETPEFGNGRFSRNLTESAMISFAARTFGPNTPNADNMSFMLRPEDFELPSNMKKVEPKRKIGFCA